MTRSRSTWGSFAGCLLALASACGGDPACPSADGLRTQLAALGSGGRVDVPSTCRLSGSFAIPAGATLHGGTFALDAGDAITLAPASTGTATTLSGARITGGASGASVHADGAGSVAITDVVIDIERGIGVGISGAGATITNLTITGNVDASNVSEVPSTGFESVYAAYGVVAIDGATIVVTGSDVSGMAGVGVVCERSTITLDASHLEANRGIGALASACTVHATDLEIAHTLSAVGAPGIGLALIDDSQLADATRLSLHDSPGYGVFARGGALTITDPTIAQQGQAGVWVEDADALHASGGAITGGAGAGIVAIGVGTVDVNGMSIAHLAEAPLPTTGGLGSVTMGDALHLVQRTGRASTITLADLMLTDNARVGLVVDGGGDTLALGITGTRVETSGTQLGALAQNVMSLATGWDGGVTRIGSASTLDGTAGPITVSDGAGSSVGILMPPTISF